MKNERSVRPGRKGAAAGVLLVLSLLIAMVSRPAYAAIDLSQPCSLIIHIGTSLQDADREDLREADIVYDLYRVADAVAVEGVDTYTWEVLAPFADEFLKEGSAAAPYMKRGEDGSVRITGSVDSRGWKAIAGESGKAALGAVEEAGKPVAPQPAGSFSDGQYISGTAAEDPLSASFSGLKAGLYLIVPRGRNLEEYVALKTNAEGEQTQASIAYSGLYEYSFSPELVSLPTKDADENGSLNTANAGEWKSGAEVDLTLKFSRERRTGSLEITKKLLSYAEREKTADGESRDVTDPATFIFEASVYESEEAYRGQAAPVFHDYLSIVFDPSGDYGITGTNPNTYQHGKDGSKTVRIDNLPIGGYAVVREVYSGKIYTTDEEKYAVIEVNDDDNTVEVEFINEYNDEHGGSGSVTNRFSYSAQDGWVHEQVTDSSQDTSREEPVDRHGNQ